jgi:hypothetical protein
LVEEKLIGAKTPPREVVETTPLKVRRARVASVDLYEIKDTELNLLEKGSPSGICLNFAIFLFSIAFTAIGSLCTATFKNSKIEILFTVISVVGSLGGLFLLILWWRTRTSVSATIKEIRNRMPPPEQEPPVSKVVPPGEAEPVSKG